MRMVVKIVLRQPRRNIGDLKRELLDLWTEERNAYAKEVMTDIEARRQEAAR